MKTARAVGARAGDSAEEVANRHALKSAVAQNQAALIGLLDRLRADMLTHFPIRNDARRRARDGNLLADATKDSDDEPNA